ncbi:MAG: glycosyltransferase family 2 protein [Sedimentisphaerales bacterium]|nr:glycosyltransferase family 2 protein [Sedimentisphaerales bacterium]
MANNSRILIIIPAYNEEDTVGQVIEKTRQSLPHADILVINDGSSDSTSAISKRHGAKVLDFPYNMGIGAAMQAGYKFAYKMGYDIAVQCDADGQHRPAQIKKLIDTLINNDVDLVLGSRYLETRRFRSSVSRRMGMLIFSNILSFIVGQKLTDTTSGFRAANREVIRTFSMYYPSDYPEPEALVLLHRGGYTIKEISINMNSRKGGYSSITASKSVYYMIKVMLAIFIDLCKKPITTKSPKTKDEGNVEDTNYIRNGEHSAVDDCVRAYQNEKA